MVKLKGLLLTEGMHGMISQAEGLARAMDLDFIHEKIELNGIWKFFPPIATPIKEFVFKNKITKKFDVVISCGRKSVVPSIYLKKKYKNKILNIHIQNPKISLNNFDYIVSPEHDELIGNNVLNTKGAIHYLTNEEIDTNEDYLKDKIVNKDKKILTFIVGGPNKYYSYDPSLIEQIFIKINNNFLKKNYQLILIPSIRTPKAVIEKAKDFFNDEQLIITKVDKKAYLSGLKLADHIVVTCDSTSMISEASITGKPIYVAQMPSVKKNIRFNNFFKLFKSMNIIRDLGSNIENWNYQSLDETNRIAKEILKNINQNV